MRIHKTLSHIAITLSLALFSYNAQANEIIFRYKGVQEPIRELNDISFSLPVIYQNDNINSSATLTNTGMGQIVWNLEGTLPSGLTVSSNRISGNPSVSGNYGPFKWTATDGLERSVESSPFNIQVNSLLEIQDFVTAANINIPFSYTLNISGGVAPYTVNLQSGSLPAGIEINGTNISGTTNATGTYNFILNIEDSNGRNNNVEGILYVQDELTASASFIDGYTGEAYTGSFTASGGSQNYIWALNGTLPDGLTFNQSTGMITGTPTTFGTFPINVTITDHPQQITVSDTLYIYGALSLASKNYIDMYTNENYSETSPVLTGGKTPVRWSSNDLSNLFNLNENTGAISFTTSGQNLSPQNYNFNLIATDANGKNINRSYNISSYSPIALSNQILPLATVGLSYNETLTSSGGKMPYTWTVATGSLPEGLTLSNVGVISGTPTNVSNNAFTIRVSDANNKNDSQSYNISSIANLSVSNSPSIEGYVSRAYTPFTYEIDGGNAPYTWIIKSGNLPAGINLSEDGIISGNPSTNGDYNFVAEVTDANNTKVEQPSNIRIYDLPLITSTLMPVSYVGENTTINLSASGGKSPYTWTIGNGNLPTGLSLTPEGLLSGSTNVTGTFNYNIEVADSNGIKSDQDFTTHVYDLPTISSDLIASSYSGDAISTNAVATGGQAPYTWIRTTGNLPTGLTLSTDGLISGTPSTAGTYNYTLETTDSNSKKSTREFTTIIYSLPSVNNDGIAYSYLNESVSKNLTASGGVAPFRWNISNGSLPTGLTLSTDGLISGTTNNVGTYNYTVRVVDSNDKAGSLTFSTTVHTNVAIANVPSSNRYVNQPISHQLNVSGGVSPYTWRVASGVLPAGINLSSNGLLSGTFSNAQTANFVVEAKDSNNKIGTQTIELQIADQLLISSDLPASLITTNSVNSSVTTSGGHGSRTIKVSNGSLPAGLSLNTSTGAITGTLSGVGNYSVVFEVQDGQGTINTVTKTGTVSNKDVTVAMTGGNGPVAIQNSFSPSDWTNPNVNKVINLPSGSIRGTTNTGQAAVSIGNAWAGSLTFNVQGEIQGAGGAANSGTGGVAFNANVSGQSGQKINTIVTGAIRGGGGGGGLGGQGGPGSVNTAVRVYNPSDQSFTYSRSGSGAKATGEFWATGDAALSITRTSLGIKFVVNPLANNKTITSYERDGITYEKGTFQGSIWPYTYYSIRQSSMQNVATHTTGGTGGAGGVGQGYGQSRSNGSAGIAGGQNAGAGSAGGIGGAWGAPGNNGITGINGNTGAGLAGINGGAAGAAITGIGNVTLTGSVNGPTR